jgi:S-adenosyl methyltransferase
LAIPRVLTAAAPVHCRALGPGLELAAGRQRPFRGRPRDGQPDLADVPGIAQLARLQRRFLVHAVRYLAGEAGIRQFLDIGTGRPSADNTHEVAQAVAPAARIVYTDNDPMVLVHAPALLTSAPGGATSYIEADVRDPDTILDAAAGTLDLSQPVALIMLGIMGQLPDSDEPHALARRYLDALPSGSYLAQCDGTDVSPALNEAIGIYNQNSASSYHLRAPEQIGTFFDGLTLIAPGLVPASRWQRGDDAVSEPAEVDATVCGVGRKQQRPTRGQPGCGGRRCCPARPARAARAYRSALTNERSPSGTSRPASSSKPTRTWSPEGERRSTDGPLRGGSCTSPHCCSAASGTARSRPAWVR